MPAISLQKRNSNMLLINLINLNSIKGKRNPKIDASQKFVIFHLKIWTQPKEKTK